jgi:hypothetical protein
MNEDNMLTIRRCSTPAGPIVPVIDNAEVGGHPSRSDP